MVPVLVLVTVGVFLLLHLTPGDPIDAMMAESADADREGALRRDLGLDRPIHVQYGPGWGGCSAATSDARSGTASRCRERAAAASGRASSSRRSRWLISLTIAFPVGIVSAMRRNSAVDRRSATTFALFGICMPNFLLALLLIFVFGVTLRWLPISGYTDPLEEPWNGLRSLALPAITLGPRWRRW